LHFYSPGYSEIRGDEASIDKKSPKITKATMRPEINITYIRANDGPFGSTSIVIG
jgi:hypothetical protein